MKKLKFEELSKNELELFDNAFEMYLKAYAPYSNFRVGASLFDIKNDIYSGCNIESADFTLTSHAEMVAIDSMVKSGSHEIQQILIVIKTSNPPGMPCGLCRQKMIEFSKNNIRIISVNLDENDKPSEIYVTDLNELLPFSFSKSQLED